MYYLKKQLYILLTVLCISFLLVKTFSDYGFFLKISAEKPNAENTVIIKTSAACEKGKSTPTGAFCLTKSNPFVGGNRMVNYQLCKNIEKIVSYSTIGDFGAGLGPYGMCFTRILKPLNAENQLDIDQQKSSYYSLMKAVKLAGTPMVIKSWEGFDGALNVEDVTGGYVKFLDLSKEIDLGKKYDWIMSLEVGEHIPKAYENIYMDNLVRHSCIGLILSWAVIGQGGYNHINNQSNDYIINRMKSKGMKFDEKATKEIKTLIRGYFYNTLMVFKNLKSKC